MMRKTNVTIRYAIAADNVLLAELGAQTFHNAFAGANKPENMAAYLASAFHSDKQVAELADPTTVFLIAEAAGTAVGYAQLQASKPPPKVTGAHPLELGFS
jgi:diamine N-acetyltransferase